MLSCYVLLILNLEFIFLTHVSIDLIEVNAPECQGRAELLLDQEHHLW